MDWRIVHSARGWPSTFCWRCGHWTKLRHMIRNILLTNVVSIWFLIFLSDLDPFILTSYPVVRRELRSYGYSYSLLNGELRSYHEFPNHILASVLASSLQSALRLSQIEMLSVWWKSRLNFLVAWTLSEYGGVMWIFLLVSICSR